MEKAWEVCLDLLSRNQGKVVDVLSFPSCPTGTENVLRACCALSIPSLLYTSSVAAVGPNTSCEPLLR